jgi:hypothetical protein
MERLADVSQPEASQARELERRQRTGYCDGILMTRREFSPDVRHAALVRAGYRCEKCESKEQLELHHIGSRQDQSAFNAMVLCTRCHARLHADRRQRFWTCIIKRPRRKLAHGVGRAHLLSGTDRRHCAHVRPSDGR